METSNSKLMVDDNVYEWYDAEYKDQIISEYGGHPYIEALPTIRPAAEDYKKLKYIPTHNPEGSDLPNELRYHAVYNANQFFRPISVHIDLINRFSILIRAGYLGRNPLHKKYYQRVGKWIDEINPDAQSNDRLRSNASGFYIVGVSGVGKSTAVKEILTHLYPQVIRHQFYKDKRFNHFQIVWLKIDCPFDGSLGGLCLNFFSAIDEILGSNYLELYGKKGAPGLDTMLISIRRLVRLHGIGCLVIDEIQQLSVAKGQGITTMLNFFVNLVNRSGMPIVLIGTPKALPLLTAEFQQARRAAGIGDLKWYPMNNSGNGKEEWNIFVRELWRYQYTKHPVNITDDLSNALFMASAGITDFAIKAFILAQFHAIETGLETLTPELILAIAEEKFSFSWDILNMLRNHNYDKLDRIPDLKLFDLKNYFDGFLTKSAQKEFSELIKEEEVETNSEVQDISKGKSEPDPITTTQNPNKTRHRKSRRSALEKTSGEGLEKDDLRYLFAQAVNKGIHPYDTLSQAGIIKDITDYFG